MSFALIVHSNDNHANGTNAANETRRRLISPRKRADEQLSMQYALYFPGKILTERTEHDLVSL
jgi:hypothetical protein